jgi:hypothetical protein
MAAVAHLEEQCQFLVLVPDDTSFCSRWMQALQAPWPGLGYSLFDFLQSSPEKSAKNRTCRRVDVEHEVMYNMQKQLISIYSLNS